MSRSGLPVQATQDTSLSAHPTPTAPVLKSPEYSDQLALSSNLSTSFDGAPHLTVNRPVDQSFIVSSQYHPPDPSATLTWCGVMNPPPGRSPANESWSWDDTSASGPSDHPGGQDTSTCANDSAVPADTLRFGSY
ncbi:uncharacterized protein TRAVEDRAFT_50941 [Trametes versicolor FP-101664 SS1]|uniref:uncharacterized protein n=1 Tax=Trametes versicolor (strain FP-101664) TaxID=717944 RepID=UPI00046223AC|nr:uncharacterized protein TRAVEDRAFT_50941 [Trametes versicolor FP-101664 SS1]EIW54805.1 hypothetical protein TRAVEDRAFT_50941 [Trametes versicolor FP-101664 SS1]